MPTNEAAHSSIEYEDDYDGRHVPHDHFNTSMGAGATGIGQDTLEEIEDKARFFKELERDEETVDFSQLNEQLQGQETMKSLIEDQNAAKDFRQPRSKDESFDVLSEIISAENEAARQPGGASLLGRG